MADKVFPTRYPNRVLDAAKPEKPIAIQYSGTQGLTTSNWFAAWGDYELRAMSAADMRQNLNVVNKSGDTMTGNLSIVKSSDPKIVFQQSATSRGNIYLRDNHLFFDEYPADQQNYCEVYMLPEPNSGLTKSNFYEILTSKTPVTLNQGGTGGTDSGWQSYTNASVFTGTIKYRKVGAFLAVMCQQFKLVENLGLNVYVQLGTLPTGYRPSQEIIANCFVNTGAVNTRNLAVRITTAGEIYLYSNNEAITNTYNLYFSGFGFI